MENLGDIDRQTLAGATSTGTHGTGGRFGGIATQIRGLELVLADGSVVRATADENAELLDLGRVGLGALGVVTAMTLQCVPQFALHVVDEPMPLDRVLDEVDDLVESNDHFEFFWFPYTDTALTRRFRRLPGDAEVRPKNRFAHWLDEAVVTNVGWEALLRVATRRPGLVPRVNRFVSGSLSAREYTDLSHRVFASRRDVRFNEGEYAFERGRFREVFAELRSLLGRLDHPVAFPFECRFVAADDIPLAPTYRRSSAYIAFHQYRSMPHAAVLRRRRGRLRRRRGAPALGQDAPARRRRARRPVPAVRRLRGPPGRARPDRRLHQRPPRPAARPAARSRAMSRYASLARATEHLEPPYAVVDLDALDANAREMARRAAGTPIRLASKSVRCRSIQRRVLGTTGFRGVLAFTLPEALWLAGGEDAVADVLVGYPTVDRTALHTLAHDEELAQRVTVLVDSPEHLSFVAAAVGEAALPVRVCLDLDASLHLLGDRVHVGPRRSPVRSAADAAAMVRAVEAYPGLTLVGLMAYEGQIAGIGDNAPNPLRRKVIRAMQRASAAELRDRRAEVVAAVRSLVPLEYVNGGGTGSLEATAAEDAVTELSAGSGLYSPALFDTYRRFRYEPAAFFVVAVVRKPTPDTATVLGGGWVASGPSGKDRLPTPSWPRGLHLSGTEGAGEVQTPLLGKAAAALRLGDRVWFRHAKGGELCERVDELHLVRGDTVVDVVPTYRGEGRAFL